MPFALDVDSARELLLEQDARRLDNNGDSSAPILGDGEVARYWSEIQPDYAHQLVAYLEEYASAKNNSKRQYVDNPIIEGEEKPGRWRQARVLVSMEGDVARVIQILRKGWRTTLLSNGAIDFSESRIIRTRELEGNSSEKAGISNTASANEEKYILVRFPNISPSNINGIMAELRGITTISNPSIKGSIFTGEYRKLYAVSDIEQSDGSMTVDLLIAQPQFTINAYRDWGGVFGGEITYLWNVPKELGQQIITDFRASGAGKGATAGYNSEQGTLDIVLTSKRTDPKSLQGVITASNCSSSAQSDYFFDVENPNDAAYEIGGASYPSASGVTYRKDVRSNNDGTYDVVITTINVVDRAYEDKIIENTRFDLTTRDYNYGLTSEAGLESLSSFVAGQIQSRSYRHNEDCTIDVTTDTQQAKNVVGVTKTVQFDSSESVEELANTNDSAEVTHASSAVLGQIVTTSSRVNRFGLWDNSTRTQYSYNQTAGGGELRHDQTVSVQKSTQAASEASPSSPSAGTVVIYDSDPTRYGKFSTVIRTITAINQTGQATELRADQTSSSETSTQRASAYTQTREDGTIVRLQSAPTEFGKFRASKEVVTAINQTASSYESGPSRSSVSVLNTQNVSPVEIGSIAPNTRVIAENVPTEFGRYRTRYEVISGSNQSGAAGECRADQTRVVSIDTNANSALAAPPDCEDGCIIRVDSQPNEFGNYRNTEEIICAVNQISTSNDERYDQRSETTLNTQNASIEVATASQGIIQIAQNTPTEFGRYRTTKQSVYSLAQSASSYESRGDQSSVSSLTTHSNSALNSASEDGKIVRITNTPTEFGTFRTVREDITSQNQSVTFVDARADQSTTSVVNTFNTSIPDSSRSAGEIVRVEASSTEFPARFRTRKDTITAVNQSGNQAEARADYTSSTSTNTQNTSNEVATHTAGSIQRVENRPTEFGKYSTSKTTVTAVNQSASDYSVRHDIETESDLNTSSLSAEALPIISSGVVKNVRNVPTEFGTYRTVVETITAKDQSSSSYEKNAARTSTTTLNTQGAALPAETPAAGSAIVIENTPTEFGLYRTRRTQVDASNQSSTSYIRSPLLDTDISVNTSQTASLPNPGAIESGSIRRVDNDPTEFGTYRTVETTQTPKAKFYQFTYVNNWNTVLVKIGRNQPQGTCASQTAEYSGSYSVSSDLNINEYGLEDFKIVTQENFNGDAWDDTSGSVEWESTDSDGKKWKIGKKWCKSRTVAEAFIGTGAASSGGGHVTTIQSASRGRFVATKVSLVSSGGS